MDQDELRTPMGVLHVLVVETCGELWLRGITTRMMDDGAGTRVRVLIDEDRLRAIIDSGRGVCQVWIDVPTDPDRVDEFTVNGRDLSDEEWPGRLGPPDDCSTAGH